MERNMPRSSPLSGGGRPRIHCEEFARHPIKPEREDLIEALVRDDDEAPAGIEFDLMGFSEGLLDTMRANLSLKDDQIHKLSERAVLVARQHRHTRRDMVCH